MSGAAVYCLDFGHPGDISWIMMIQKDGTIGYCTEAWVDRDKRTRLIFREASSILCIPKLFDSSMEANRWFRGWQQSFPAEATGWSVDIREFEA